jgi:hypothetical protein
LYDLQRSTVSLMTKEKYSLFRASGQYLAPTFSWISVPSEVTYRLGFRNGGEIVKAAKICNVQITHRGSHPFGEVLDGFVILEGPLISATLSDQQSKSDSYDSDIANPFSKTLLYLLNYGSEAGRGISIFHWQSVIT